MKLRTGFVSNSSTSSFVIVAKLKWYIKCLEEADDYVKHVIKSLKPDYIEVFETPCVVIEGYNDSEGSMFHEMPDHESEKAAWDEDSQLYLDAEGNEIDVVQNRSEALVAFEELLSRDKDRIFLHTMDL